MKFKVGQKIEIIGTSAYKAGDRVVTITEIKPKYDKNGELYYHWENGLHIENSQGIVSWVHMGDVLQIIE